MTLRSAFERLAPIPDDVWAVFEPAWEPVEFAKGVRITQAGEHEPYLYFVLDGVQRMFFPHPDGREIVLGFSYAGDFSGVFDSFRTNEPALSTLQALADSQLLRISKADFNAALDEHRCLERWLLTFTERIFFGRLKREVHLLTMSADERYLRLLTQSPHLIQLVPQKDIASYLGMTPETLSRVRRRMGSLRSRGTWSSGT
ncbi:MAG: Crp/Fnr family transcriptional regulator [Bacteroidota bacterium]